MNWDVGMGPGLSKVVGKVDSFPVVERVSVPFHPFSSSLGLEMVLWPS